MIRTYFSPFVQSLSFRKQLKLGLSNQHNAIAGSGAPLQEITSLSGYFEALRSKKEWYEAAIVRRDALSFRSAYKLQFGREIQVNDVLPEVLPFPVKTCSLYDLVRLNALQDSYAIKNVDLMGLSQNVDLIVDIMSNLVHKIGKFHASGEVILNLKPQDIIVSEEDCKLFASIDLEDRDSLGWKAPEHLLHQTLTKASNMFSFGCILYYCITGGFHPFGDTSDQRIHNIKANKMDISRATNDDAYNLISLLLSPEPELRPNAREVLCHPFFWDLEMKVGFLNDIIIFTEEDQILANEMESKLKLLMNPDWCKKLNDCYYALIDMEKPTAKDIPDVFGPPGSPTFLPKILMKAYEIATKHYKDEDDEWLIPYNFPETGFTRVDSIGYRLFKVSDWIQI